TKFRGGAHATTPSKPDVPGSGAEASATLVSHDMSGRGVPTSCASCGRFAPCVPISSGTYHCQACALRLPRTSCSDCGTSIRHLPSETVERCERCAKKHQSVGKPCNRC